MRRRAVISLVIVLLLAACVLSTACDGAQKNEENLPVTSWQDFLVDVAGALDRQYMNISVKSPVAFSIRCDAVDNGTGDRYECSLELNLDLTRAQGQEGALRIERIREDERRILLDVYSSDSTLYWSLWQEDQGEYQRNVFDHAPLIYAITKAVATVDGSVDYSTPGSLFVALGKVFFTDGNANADGTQYYFDFDLKKGLGDAASKKLFGNFPDVLQKVFLSVAKVDNYTDMLDRTPSIKGKIKITLKDGKVDTVDCDDLYYDNVADGVQKQLSCSVPEYDILNGSKDLSAYVPNASLYEEGRLTDVTSIGKVKFLNTDLDRAEAEYDYELRAKIDMLELFVNDGDLNSLSADNFFHFRISHKCGDGCSAFCADKYDRAKGAVLDVAFSPEDFGNYNVYISLGVRAFIGPRIVSELTDWKSVGNFIPEYALAVVSSDTLIARTSESAPSEYGVATVIEALLMAMTYSESSLSMPIENILNLIGLDATATDLIGKIFESDSYSIDTVSVEQEYLRWSVSDYDVKRSAIHLYGNDVPETKKYGIESMPSLLPDPYLDYECERQSVVDGKDTKSVAPLYNASYVDGKLYDSDTPMSKHEVGDIVGSEIKARGENIYGAYSDCELVVVGHSEIDLTSKDWQSIRLYCLPKGKGLWRYVWNSLRDTGLAKWLCMSVSTDIKLSDMGTVDFVRPEKTDYMQGERLSSSDTPEKIYADLKYATGETKRRFVYATNSSDAVFEGASGSQRFIKCSSDTVLNFYLFGYYVGYKLKITPATEVKLENKSDTLSLEYKDSGYASELRVAEVVWALADGRTTRATLPLSYMKINGYAIDSHNNLFFLDPAQSGAIIFRRAGKYTLDFEFDGMRSETTLYVAPKAQETDKSDYSIKDTTNRKDYYFVDYSYAFSAEIFNKTHGDEGRSETVKVTVKRAQLNASGDLVYREIADSENYYLISEAQIDGVGVQFPHTVDLPKTIYKNIPIKFNLLFKQKGYYEISVSLGASSSDSVNIRISVGDISDLLN